MSSKGWSIYISTTGREYAKCGGKTHNCCRVNPPVGWIYVVKIKRYINPRPY